MKSLVTGGCGFIGSHLVDKLVELGHEVTVIDTAFPKYKNEKAKYVRQDICDYHITRIFYYGVDYVFHMAAEAKIGECIENPLRAVSANTMGTATVLQCSREAGVKRVVYSSTSSGYGLNEPPNVETQSDDCLNPYSVSKIGGEKLCKMYTDLYEFPTVILRYFNAYGDRQAETGQYAPVMGIFFRQRDAGEELTIVGDGEQRRDFVHVSDIVNANIMCAIGNPDEEYYGQVYNVGTGINYSVKEIADMISDKQTYLPPRVGEARVSLSNCDKIKKVFGWEPKVKLEDWIKEYGKEQVTP